MQLLISGATPSSLPDPTISGAFPFMANNVGRFTAGGLWVASGKKALVLNQTPEINSQKSCRIDLIPSVAGATYRVKAWRGNRISKTWANPKVNGTLDFTGPQTTTLDNLDIDPWVFQLVSISSGTLDIYYDETMMGVV